MMQGTIIVPQSNRVPRVAIMWHLVSTRYVAISISHTAVKQHKTERTRLHSNNLPERKHQDQMGQTAYQPTKAVSLHNWEHCAPVFSCCKDQISPCV